MKLHEFKSEPQNIEQEISNDEVWNRFAQSFFKKIIDRSTRKLTTGRIPYFDIHYSLLTVRRRRIRYSIFAFSKFLFRFDWTLAARGDAHMKLLQVKCEPQNRRISNPPPADRCRMSKDGIASLSLL